MRKRTTDKVSEALNLKNAHKGGRRNPGSELKEEHSPQNRSEAQRHSSERVLPPLRHPTATRGKRKDCLLAWQAPSTSVAP